MNEHIHVHWRALAALGLAWGLVSGLAACGGGGGDTPVAQPAALPTCSTAAKAAAAKSTLTTVCVQTSAGEMVFELDTAKAPITTSNFLKYVNDGFYANTLFHRVIANFVIQGGGYTAGMVYKAPTYPDIALESQNGLSNLKYTLAMARGTAANSANSQFYVNLVDNTFLDHSATTDGYAVFGKVIYGMAVVDAIGVTTTNSANVPLTNVVTTQMVKLP
jgi:peptidyl-prolyl cis-trans isomerase A (cyclophilin A)